MRRIAAVITGVVALAGVICGQGSARRFSN